MTRHAKKWIKRFEDTYETIPLIFFLVIGVLRWCSRSGPCRRDYGFGPVDNANENSSDTRSSFQVMSLTLHVRHCPNEFKGESCIPHMALIISREKLWAWTQVTIAGSPLTTWRTIYSHAASHMHANERTNERTHSSDGENWGSGPETFLNAGLDVSACETFLFLKTLGSGKNNLDIKKKKFSNLAI